MTDFTIEDNLKNSLNIGKQTIKPSVMIATPMFAGQCTGHFTIATINAINEMKARGTEMFLANIMNESLIIRARNELVRMFLDKTSCSHIMFIDADIYYESTAIPRLLDHDVDVVCGAYPKKEINWDRINLASTLKEKATSLEKYAGSYVLNTNTAEIKMNDKGLLNVRHGGTGFMMIKREVFKQLSESTKEYRASTIKDADNNYVKPITKMFFDTSIDHTGALLSEDYHFCETWNALGGEIFLDPAIKLKHIGSHIFEGSLFTDSPWEKRNKGEGKLYKDN